MLELSDILINNINIVFIYYISVGNIIGWG